MTDTSVLRFPSPSLGRARRSRSAPSPRQETKASRVQSMGPYRRRATYTATWKNYNRQVGASKETLNTKRTTKPLIWHVTNESLRSVPRFYPISKSSIRVTGESANVLAERLSTFFRINSISAKYDDRNASVEAETRDQLFFNVVIWNGGINENEFSSEIIVEVQKIGGDSVEFHALCGALFKAIKGEEPVQDANRDAPTIPYADHAQLFNEEIIEEPSREAVNALSVTLGMLESPRVDSKRLGLEYMCFLTNVGTVLRADAVFLSHSFLFGEEKTGLRLRNCIASHIAQKEAPQGESEGEPLDDDEDLVATAAQQVGMRNLALQVLANALSVTAAEGMLSEKFSTLPRFWFGVISDLVDVLGEASTFPHDATLSAVCLSHLIQCSAGEERRELERRILPSLTEAYMFGKERYRLLELKSLELLQLMDLDYAEFQ